MRVFQHAVTLRNASQRKSFFSQQKSVTLQIWEKRERGRIQRLPKVLKYPLLSQERVKLGNTKRRLRLLAALRKQIETTSIFPQRWRRTRPIRAAITFDTAERCGSCGCFTLRCVALHSECWKTRIRCECVYLFTTLPLL